MYEPNRDQRLDNPGLCKFNFHHWGLWKVLVERVFGHDNWSGGGGKFKIEIAQPDNPESVDTISTHMSCRISEGRYWQCRFFVFCFLHKGWCLNSLGLSLQHIVLCKNRMRQLVNNFPLPARQVGSNKATSEHRGHLCASLSRIYREKNCIWMCLHSMIKYG